MPRSPIYPQIQHTPAERAVADPAQDTAAAHGPVAVGKPPVAPGSGEAPQRGKGLALPHERDESIGSAGDGPRRVIEQAKRDLDAGQVDTDMRATPGLDAARRDKLVPRA